MLLVGIALDEAAIEIRDQVRCPPIQCGSDGRHECSHESGHYDTPQSRRYMLTHHQHVSGFGMFQVWVKDDGGHGGKNPRPGPQRVMGDVEPKHGEQSVTLIFGAEDALRDVAAATWFRAWVPERPPLHSNIYQES